MSQKCTNFKDIKDLDLEDCFGAVSISQSWDIKGYSLKDHVHNVMLAEIDTSNGYKFQDGNIYVKNRSPFNCSVTDNNGKQQFCIHTVENNQLVTKYYDNQSDIPLYLVIQTQTGNVTSYLDLSEMPQNDLVNFQNLGK